jgi:hypothetical protein
MKKYILGVAIVGLFCMPQVGMAMKKEIKTSLSSKEEAELRNAVMDYKKNKSPSKQEQIINKYTKKYPNDSLVKAKLNELAKFKSPAQSVVVSQSPKKQPTQKPNLGVFNDSMGTIRLDVYYLSEGYSSSQLIPQTSLTTILKPYGTIVMHVEEGNVVEIMVSTYDQTRDHFVNVVGGRLNPLTKGQVVGATYGDDGKYVEEDEDGITRTIPHLYETGRR